MELVSPVVEKRRTFPDPNLTAVMHEKFGREIKVYKTRNPSSQHNGVPGAGQACHECRLLETIEEHRFLNPWRVCESEEAAERSLIKKTLVRVTFRDNCTLEASFDPSEKIQSLIALLWKVIAHPELPFYLYTTPNKRRVKDTSRDFYSAGFFPGAALYFAYDLPPGVRGPLSKKGPFLRDDVMSLLQLETIGEQTESVIAIPVAKNTPYCL